MHATRNSLPDNTRKAVIQLLQASVADGVDLQTQVKQAHWNVKGPSFRGLHELFDQVYGVVQTQVDAIAERLVTLGGVAEGTARVAAQRSRLPEYPLDLVEGRAHAEALAGAVARFAASCREAIDAADEAGDAVTADLYTQVVGALDEQVWMIEAHTQAER